MTNIEDEKLTTTETALRDTWGRIAAGHTGATAKLHGWPQPTPEQVDAMTRILNEALNHFVRGFRNPAANAPTPGELNEVFEGMALGCSSA